MKEGRPVPHLDLQKGSSQKGAKDRTIFVWVLDEAQKAESS